MNFRNRDLGTPRASRVGDGAPAIANFWLTNMSMSMSKIKNKIKRKY